MKINDIASGIISRNEIIGNKAKGILKYNHFQKYLRKNERIMMKYYFFVIF